MIILGIVLLLLVAVLTGLATRGGLQLLSFLVFPEGRNRRAPWLVLLLVATCLGVVVFLQHGLHH